MILGLTTSAPSMAAGSSPALSAPELTARWWQWAFSFPTNVNPLTDSSGERCTFGQNGDVWFLGGSFSSSEVKRKCTPVPIGHHILIPALNAECSSVEGDGETGPVLRRCANNLIHGARGTVTVDGKSARVVRVTSPLFLFSLPKTDDVLGRGPAVSKAVAAGLWALIPPLRAGKHEIQVEGSVGDFTQNITYSVIVVAP
jgi:hypothetical protein